MFRFDIYVVISHADIAVCTARSLSILRTPSHIAPNVTRLSDCFDCPRGLAAEIKTGALTVGPIILTLARLMLSGLRCWYACSLPDQVREERHACSAKPPRACGLGDFTHDLGHTMLQIIGDAEQ